MATHHSKTIETRAQRHHVAALRVRIQGVGLDHAGLDLRTEGKHGQDIAEHTHTYIEVRTRL